MSYQVLARKYRPRTFDQMVGQEHVLRALINALDQNRLHHAYLFTGTRGVGKTTLARLFAKCLNCETGIGSKPCEQCTACQEINTGRFVDLIEVDAASRTKVEDTRELLENVQYAPTRGRYKVYLIDEVHMLSTHSFNALLKTLEEPPPHIIFLLATTDPQRLPVTVLSRCLQFNLKNLSPEQILTQLETVLKQENINFEVTANKLIAHAANGSMRDALSLLDQAIAYSGNKVIEQDVRAMLGTIEQTHIFELLTAVMANDANKIVTIIHQLAEQAADFINVLEEFISTLHQIAIAQVVAGIQSENSEKIYQFTKQISAEDIQLYYQIGLIGRRDISLAPSLRTGFEMVMLRMLAFKPVEIKTRPITTSSNNSEVSKLTSMPHGSRPIPGRDDKKGDNSQLPSRNDTPISTGEFDWQTIVTQLNLTGFALALANNCSLKEYKDNRVSLLLDPNQTAMHNPKNEARLAEALSNHLGKPTTIKISVGTTNMATPAQQTQQQRTEKLQTASKNLENDANLQALIKVFDAKIQPDSIQAIESET